ncbi:hypothetical protein RSAG8_11944, partial [Rhizoctonia solani AG-8 WAC10335]
MECKLLITRILSKHSPGSNDETLLTRLRKRSAEAVTQGNSVLGCHPPDGSKDSDDDDKITVYRGFSFTCMRSVDMITISLFVI